jgi:YD repeat-containing protein
MEWSNTDQSHCGCDWWRAGVIPRLFVATQRMVKAALLVLLFSCVGLSVASAATQYIYDDLGRVSRVINTDGSIIDYQYDANGNPTVINRSGAQTLAVVRVAPTAVHIGAALNIYGTNFDPVPANNNVTVGGAVATVIAATRNALVVIVPLAAISGPITVTVSGTTVTSSQSVTILRPTIASFSPAIVNPGVAVTVQGLNLNLVPGSTTMLVGAANVAVSSLTNNQATFTAPSTSGNITVNTSYGQTISAAPLNVIPAAIPMANVAGLANLAIGGASQSLSISQPSQYALYKFDAVQGQYLGIQVSSLTTTPAGSIINYQVYSPSNAVIASGYVPSVGSTIYLPAIPATGSYLVSLTSSTATFQLTAALQINPAATVDGAPFVVTNALQGQPTRVTFSGNAGENLGVGISGLIRTNGNSGYSYVYLNVYKPDGTVMVSNRQCSQSNGGCEVNLNILVTGQYSLLLTSPNPAVEPNLTLSFAASVTHDLVTPLIADTPTSVSLRNGQNGRFTFSANAGDYFAFEIGGLTSTPAGRQMNYKIYRPDGTLHTSYTLAAGMSFTMNNVPATGVYTLFIDPQYGATTNITVMASTSGANTVVVDGPIQPRSNAAIPGSFNYFAFYGTAGESLGIGISNVVAQNATAGYGWAGVYIRKPDGTVLVSPGCTFSTGCDINLTNLPQTGIYTFGIQSPNMENEPRLQLSFNVKISRDLVVPLTANTPTTMMLGSGQNGRFTFSGAAGDYMGVQIGAPTTVPSGRLVTYTIFKPDGTTLASSGGISGRTYTLHNLPATGTYTLLVDPQHGASATVIAMIVPSNSAAAVIDGTSINISNAQVPGAYDYFTFSAQAGENVGIGISNMVAVNPLYGFVGVYVRKPDGSLLKDSTCSYDNGCEFNLTNLQQTGIYTLIFVSPNPDNEPKLKLSFTATVSRDQVTVLTTGISSAISITRNGQNGRLTFAGTVGSAATLQVTGISTTPTGRSVSLVVYKPDGSTLSSASATGSSHTFNLTNLPATGTYTLFVDPQYGAAANLAVTRQ